MATKASSQNTFCDLGYWSAELLSADPVILLNEQEDAALAAFRTWLTVRGIHLRPVNDPSASAPTHSVLPQPEARGPWRYHNWTQPPGKVFWHHDHYQYNQRKSWLLVWANMLPTCIRSMPQMNLEEWKRKAIWGDWGNPEGDPLVVPTLAGHVYLFADWLYQHATPLDVKGQPRWFIREFSASDPRGQQP